MEFSWNYERQMNLRIFILLFHFLEKLYKDNKEGQKKL